MDAGRYVLGTSGMVPKDLQGIFKNFKKQRFLFSLQPERLSRMFIPEPQFYRRLLYTFKLMIHETSRSVDMQTFNEGTDRILER